MKKVFALILAFVYMTMTNAVIHAQSLGVFSHTENIGTHCHQAPSSDTGPQNVDCCELVTSNQYSQVDIKIKSVYKYFSFAIAPVSLPTNVILDQIVLYKPDFSLHPGWNPDIKYQKFSDLTGIIVDLA